MSDPRTAQLQSPPDTAERKARQWDGWLDLVPQFRKGKRKSTVPGLDGEALSRKYSSEQRAYHPRILQGTFDVFVPMDWAHYEKRRNHAILRFIDAMDKQGWRWDSTRKITVRPGMYPAVDPITGISLPDRQEFVVEGWFRFEKPEPIRVELEPEVREPLELVH